MEFRILGPLEVWALNPRARGPTGPVGPMSPAYARASAAGRRAARQASARRMRPPVRSTAPA